MKSVGLIVGHDVINQGAKSYNGITEYLYNLRVVNLVYESLKNQPINIYISTKTGLDYSRICEKYLENDIDLSIELHFNWFPQPIKGMEALVVENWTIGIADRLTNLLADDLEISQRHKNGVKMVKEGDRGYACLNPVLNYAEHCILLEPCFANIKTFDSMKLFEQGGAELYANALSDAILECLGIYN